MTNYNERLDKIFKGIDKSIQARIMREPLSDESYIVDMRLKLADAVSAEAKQAITSLIRELVEESKPDYRKPSYGNGVDESLALSYSDKEYNLALDQFEQNLLKALEVTNGN